MSLDPGQTPLHCIKLVAQMTHIPVQAAFGRVGWLGENNTPQRDSPHILQT